MPYVISDEDAGWSKEEELQPLNLFRFSGPSTDLSNLLLRDPANRVFYSSFSPEKALENADARQLSTVRTRERRTRSSLVSRHEEEMFGVSPRAKDMLNFLHHVEDLQPVLRKQRMRMIKERRKHEMEIAKREAPPPKECSYLNLVPLHQRYLVYEPAMQKASIRERGLRRQQTVQQSLDIHPEKWVEQLRATEERLVAWRSSLSEKAAEIERIWEEVTTEMNEKEQQQGEREQELKSERNEVTSALAALDAWQEELERRTKEVERREERLAEFQQSFADPSKS